MQLGDSLVLLAAYMRQHQHLTAKLKRHASWQWLFQLPWAQVKAVLCHISLSCSALLHFSDPLPVLIMVSGWCMHVLRIHLHERSRQVCVNMVLSVYHMHVIIISRKALMLLPVLSPATWHGHCDGLQHQTSCNIRALQRLPLACCCLCHVCSPF